MEDFSCGLFSCRDCWFPAEIAGFPQSPVIFTLIYADGYLIVCYESAFDLPNNGTTINH